MYTMYEITREGIKRVGKFDTYNKAHKYAKKAGCFYAVDKQGRKFWF